MIYRYDIGITKYPYGQELEFVDASLEQLEKQFQKTEIPIVYMRNHKSSSTIYNRNYLDIDSTVSVEKEKKIYGGEISSRLYNNEKIDWIELKKICKILRENGAKINNSCSNQINIKLEKVKKPPKFMETLAKIVSIYENEMDLYYMGDCFLIRDEKETYARHLRPTLLNKVNKIEFNEHTDYLYNLLYHDQATFVKRDGISLQDYRVSKRMEIRYPNGTLNEKTIQNNLNFSLKLVNAINEEKFDIERLTYEVEKDLETGKYLLEFLTLPEDYKKFNYLVTTIATSSEDENDFMSQYEKVLSTRPKSR